MNYRLNISAYVNKNLQSYVIDEQYVCVGASIVASPRIRFHVRFKNDRRTVIRDDGVLVEYTCYFLDLPLLM